MIQMLPQAEQSNVPNHEYTKVHVCKWRSTLLTRNTKCDRLNLFMLTFHINRDGFRRPPPQLVLSCTVILSKIWGLDGAEDKLCFFNERSRIWIFVLLVPGIISCWVSISAAGQSHWTALHYLTRGTHWHRGKLRSIWRRYEQALKVKTYYHTRLTILIKMYLVSL